MNPCRGYGEERRGIGIRKRKLKKIDLLPSEQIKPT